MSWYPDCQENVNTQNTSMNRSLSHGSNASDATISSFVSFKADDTSAIVQYQSSSQSSQDPSQPTPIDVDIDTERMRSIQGQTIEENLLDLRGAENKYHVYEPAAEYVKYRKIIVAWMFEVGHEYNLADTTIEMAVAYLDRILGRTTVHKTRLQLVSLVCMLLAAKHEEDPDTVPSMEQLNACTNGAYNVPLIRNMEVMVLKNLEWQLNVVVPLHFLKLYMQLGIVYSDDTLEDDRPISERFVLFVQKHVQFFAEMCDHDYEFQQYPRSLLAAGIIAAARRVCGIRPDWNAQLKSLTGYGARSLHACFKHIYTHYETQYPNHNVSVITPTKSEEIGELNQ